MKINSQVSEITISYKPAIANKPIIISPLDAFTFDYIR